MRHHMKELTIRYHDRVDQFRGNEPISNEFFAYLFRKMIFEYCLRFFLEFL